MKKMNSRHLARVIIFSLLFAAVGGGSVPAALAQSFTLTPSALTPAAVNAGDSAVGNVSVVGTGTPPFDNAVSFTCTVSSSTVTSNLPTCVISPDSVIPPADPSITISTCAGVTSTCTGPTPTGVYTIAIVGTSGSIVVNAPALAINVVGATAQDYALSVLPTTATPSPINAGNSATTTVTVSGIGTYTGSVTVACLSITPVVEAEPYCSFNPPTVMVSSGSAAPTTVLTITTLGPIPVVTELFHVRRAFLATFLAFPAIAIIAATGKKRKAGFLASFLLLSVAGGLLLLPACGGPAKNNPTGLTTPKNTYTFTLTATDNNGNGPANSTASPATVTLTVN
jgi:hypothetical protein